MNLFKSLSQLFKRTNTGPLKSFYQETLDKDIGLGEKAREIRQNFEKRLFLSSMMGITDGSFCRERRKGCAMVQIGAYLAEPPS